MAPQAQELTDADFATKLATPELTDADFQAQPIQPTVTAPPAPQATTYLSDKNLVVQHAADMSHDQVNDSIQKQLYGWIPAHSIAEIAKAVPLGIEDLGSGAAGLMKMIGEVAQHGKGEGIEPEPQFVQEAGKHLVDLGQKAIDFIKKRQEKGIEAADPAMFQGSFLSNPSFTRVIAGAIRGVPLLAATSAIALAVGPEAALGSLGLITSGQQYESAREHASSVVRSAAVAGVSGIGNMIIAGIPIGKALGGFGTVAEGAGAFAGVSAAMTPFNNIMARIGGDKARHLFDGFAESIIAGLLTGGAWAGLTPGRGSEIDAMVQDAHKEGVPAVDIDGARAEIGKQIAENPEVVTNAIQQVTKPPKLKPTDVVSTIGETQITHQDVLNEASDLHAKEMDKFNDISELEKFALENKISKNPIDPGTRKVPEAEENRSIPLRFKNNAMGKPIDTVAQDAYNQLGIGDGTSNTYRELLKSIPERGKPPTKSSFYHDALWNLENQASNTDFNYGENEPKETQVAAEQPADFFSQSPENVVDRYDRLIKQATDQGLNPLQAQKWAREQLRTNPHAGLPELPKQTEFGVEGGVEGFGQGRKGERSLFENRSPLEVSEPNKNNRYVKNDAFKLDFEPESDKETAKDIRQQFSEKKNAQIVRGNQFGESIERAVPNEKDREAMAWYLDAKGEVDTLTTWLDDPKLSYYHDQIARALNLSPEAISKMKDVRQFFDEAGRVSQEIGTIKNLRENYLNRIAEPEPPKEFIASDKKSGLPQTTAHAKERVYETMADRVIDSGKNGKVFATTDVAKLVRMYNEEMAWVNTSRSLTDAMVAKGLGSYSNDPIPGWEKVGNIQKSQKFIDSEGQPQFTSKAFMAPASIAKGLQAITDPNWARKIDTLRGIQKYQGLVKTFDLSLSFFHHLTFGIQTINNGGIRALLAAGKMKEIMASPDFQNNEISFTEHGGMVSTVMQNQDIMHSLVDNSGDTFSKITNLPAIKQSLTGIEKSGDFLFDHVQRYLKVTGWGKQMSDWMAKNPNATNSEVKAAGRGFANEINNVYGGQNWEAMGMTKSNLTLLRLGMLAPDYFISNAKYMTALGKGGTEGKATRGNMMTAMAIGIIGTEGINKILTGHFTDENKKGHQLEIEVAPNVYVNLFRGGPGEIIKLASMIAESGPYQGLSRYSQGKLAPFPRTAVGLLARTDYSGKQIKTTYEALKFLLGSLGPIPFSITNLGSYLKNEPNKSLLGGAAVATGIGRYSKSGHPQSKYKL